jgi:putative oxidoreductase
MTLSIVTLLGSLRLSPCRIGSFAVRALVAATFVLAGAANISSTPSVDEMIETIGIDNWLRYIAALVEFTGAAMLLLPGFNGLGALLLAVTMVGALLGHLFVFGDSPVETLDLLAATGAILWYRRRELLVPYRRYLGRRGLAGLVVADLYLRFFWLWLGVGLAWSGMAAVLPVVLVR